MDYAKAYGQLHENEKYFAGYSIKEVVPAVAAMVAATGAKRLLDYGSGKGYQYLGLRVHEQWGGILPVCYDPGVRQLAAKPTGKFDGVICTDVMEHIEERDVDETLREIFGYLRSGAAVETFAVFSICCVPAKKTLPDGRGVHLTVKTPVWWQAKLQHLRDQCVEHTGQKMLLDVHFDTKER